MTSNNALTSSITRQINRSRKSVTILFTDIQDSTEYWDKHGDVKGRLMVDQHNRLVFPIVRFFRGRVVKTIGDSIMASFKKPEDAIKAAICIQQALHGMRQKDRKFSLRVRIGIHTGKAIVEDADVFGDVVNVAARVESQGKGNQILVSGGTAAKLSNKEYRLQRHGSFSPKGKRSEISLYRCDWQQYEDLSRKVNYQSWLPLVPRQKKELLFYIAVFAGAMYFIYLKYLRYVLADSEDVTLIFLNPGLLLDQYPVALGATGVVVAGLLVLFWRSRTIPRFLLHIIKGGFGFAVAFMVAYWGIAYTQFDQQRYWNEKLYESKHLFVHVLEDRLPVYERPTITAKKIQSASEGSLLLLTDTAQSYGYTWNKVLIAPGEYGWVERVTARKKRVTLTSKFYFDYKSLYGLLLGLLGFIWGVLDFRVKPT